MKAYDMDGRYLGETNGAASTLRDQFAMAALTGMLAYSNVNPMYGNYHENCTAERTAFQAYAYADAMLAARKEQP